MWKDATARTPSALFPSRCSGGRVLIDAGLDAPLRECLCAGRKPDARDFATYHLWISAVNSNRWHTRNPMDNTEVDGTFVYNNYRIIYNAQPLFSGAPGIEPTPPPARPESIGSTTK
jgi:hypothetical protein